MPFLTWKQARASALIALVASTIFWIEISRQAHASAESFLGTAQQTAPSLAIIGDGGFWSQRTRSVQRSIEASGVRDLLLAGDNLYFDDVYTYSDAWSPWQQKGFRFPLVAIGNHNGGYRQETDFFHTPGEYYSMTWGPDTRFIVLNSDNSSSAKEQILWARKEIQQATEKLIFLVYHHPSLTVSTTHDWREREGFQREVHALLRELRPRITAVLNGHDHIATLLHFNDLPIFVSGAVADIRSAAVLDNTQEGFSVKTAWVFDESTYWIRLDVPPFLAPRGEALLQFIRASDNRVMCSVRVTTGQPAELANDCTTH